VVKCSSERSGRGQETPSTRADQSLLFSSYAAIKQQRAPRQSKALFLKGRTHIYLQSRGLEGFLVGALHQLVPKAVVAFLHSNRLTGVPAISKLTSLRMLYLQVRLSRVA
jgi:hypothetical protein